ncbi:hypothetical protein ACMFMG_009153 [Clarireedia jacksonii]
MVSLYVVSGIRNKKLFLFLSDTYKSSHRSYHKVTYGRYSMFNTSRMDKRSASIPVDDSGTDFTNFISTSDFLHRLVRMSTQIVDALPLCQIHRHRAKPSPNPNESTLPPVKNSTPASQFPHIKAAAKKAYIQDFASVTVSSEY